MTRQMTLSLNPDEALDCLDRLVAEDAEIERIEDRIEMAKEALKGLKEELADAKDRRARMSKELREDADASLPMGGKAGVA